MCVKENFYRVTGADGVPHNRVELLFGVVDTELRRVQNPFNQLEDPTTLEFDDLIGLGVSVAMQRMRTLQQRRLQQQHNAWFIAQEFGGYETIDDDVNDPYRLAGVHTKLIYDAMWEAADVMTTRQIEVWHDPTGRFMTCDAPVLIPFIRNVRPGLLSAPYVIWPISPNRAVALSNDDRGEKAVMREADGKLVGMVRKAVEQGRERMIFASHEQYDRLPTSKMFRRRTQVRLRCSDHTPNGKHLPPPGCCVESGEAFSTGPDVALCDHGRHLAAPTMRCYI